MTEYQLDGDRRSAADSLKTWGNLLNRVETGLASRGRAVTAVRFDGVARPSFRAEEESRRRLVNMGNIEMDSNTAAALLAETMTAARSSIGVLAAGSARLAVQFRTGDPLRANKELGRLIEAVRTLTVLTAAIADVVSLQSKGRETLHAADVTGPVGAAVRNLVTCQSREDWTATADCLQYALGPAIARWHRLFDRLQELREAA